MSDPKVTTPKEATPEMTYEVESWAGMANYSCKLCPFASLDLDITVDHINQKHGVGAVGPKEIPPELVTQSAPEARGDEVKASKEEKTS